MKNSSIQTEDLFSAALELPSELRIKFLDEKCAGDRALKEKLQSLLAADEEVSNEDFLQRSCLEQNVVILAEKLLNDGWIGKTIGHYRILEKISSGGMGAVYLAVRDDKQFEKRVAVKIIKRGMDSEAVLQRFLLERQILANLEHPNIARLLDAGMTEDETPYFVMEYVEGVPLDDFCAGQPLSLEEKLKLFRGVCSAVEFAHRNLIVHRDLKPSNILITADGTPKLLDFGIAKLLDSDNAETTALESRVLTPAYASPEQLKGGCITKATDIYSLGVILFELLTNHRPYKTDSDSDYAQYVRAVCETDPVRPSSAVHVSFSGPGKKTNENQQRETGRNQANSKFKILNPKSLKGDLDNIILKAIEKEPTRRYPSVESFSEDIRRHLAGLPVTARPDTTGYRVSRFIQRNRSMAVLTAILAIVLLASFTAVVRQNARTEKHLRELHELNSRLSFATSDEGGAQTSTQARYELARNTVERLNNLAPELEMNAVLRLDLANAYINLGDLQGRPYHVNVGDSAGARASYEHALKLLETSSTENPSDETIRRALATANERYGYLLAIRLGERDKGYPYLQASVNLRESLWQANPASRQIRRELAEGYLRLSDGLPKSYKSPGADNSAPPNPHKESLLIVRQALELREAILREDPTEIQSKRDVAQARQRVGFSLIRNREQGKNNEKLFRESLENMFVAQRLREEIASGVEATPVDSRRLADQYLVTGIAQLSLKEYEEALENFYRSHDIFQTIVVSDPNNTESRRDLGNSMAYMGEAFAGQNKRDEARRQFLAAQQVFQEIYDKDPNQEDLSNLKRIQEELDEL